MNGDLSNEAKQAKKDYYKKWKAENRERVNEYHRNWAKKNREKVNAIQARYWDKKASGG